MPKDRDVLDKKSGFVVVGASNAEAVKARGGSAWEECAARKKDKDDEEKKTSKSKPRPA